MVYLLQQVINLGLKISWWEPIDPNTIDESILSCVFPYWPLVTFFHALSALIPNWRIHPLLLIFGARLTLSCSVEEVFLDVAQDHLVRKVWQSFTIHCNKNELTQKTSVRDAGLYSHPWCHTAFNGELSTFTGRKAGEPLGTLGTSYVKGPQYRCSQITIVVLLGWLLQAWKMILQAVWHAKHS